VARARVHAALGDGLEHIFLEDKTDPNGVVVSRPPLPARAAKPVIVKIPARPKVSLEARNQARKLRGAGTGLPAGAAELLERRAAARKAKDFAASDALRDELAAIGVPQVVEDRPDLHRHFREGSEILVARTPGQLKGLTMEALQDRPWAEEVAAGARQRALGSTPTCTACTRCFRL